MISMPATNATHSRVAAILVNWRAPQMTLRAVSEVFKQTRPPDHVFVVENGSKDDSGAIIRAGLAPWEDKTTLIVNKLNRGFGSGCNPAIDASISRGFDYIWLLNNDALPDSECLNALLVAALDCPGPIGAVGSLLIDPTNKHAPHFGSWMRPALMSCGSVTDLGDLRRPYAWCTAASLLLSTKAIAAVGGFDEEFFMYWEDADLNLRLRKAGYVICCAANARVQHEAGTSSASIPVQRYLWHFDSQRRFLRRHHRHPIAASVALRGKFLLKAVVDRDLERIMSLLRHR
jgi:GT2 family glycosyltransferase